MNRGTTVDVRRRRDFYLLIHGISTAINLGLSLAFLLAPDTRFTTASWTPLLDWSNGQVEPWGIAIGLAGVLMATRTLYGDVIGEFLAVCWFSFLAAAFLVALKDPAASITGCIVYPGLMAVNAALLTQRAIDLSNARRTKTRG